MPTDHRTPTEIEHEIERERAELDSTVRELQDRFTPERVVREVTAGFREHGGDITRAVSRSVKQNPIGLALTGVGLAWLVFGRSYDPLGRRTVYRDPYDYGYDRGDRYDTHSGTHYAGRDFELTVPQNSSYKKPGRHSPDWMDPEDHDVGMTDRASYGAYHVGDGVSSAAGSAASGISSAAGSVAGAAGSAASGVGHAAGSAASGVGHAAGSAASGVGHAAGSAASGVGHAASSAGRGIAGAAGSAASGIGHAASSAGHGISSAASSAGRGISGAAHSAGEAGSAAWARLARGTEHMSEAARDRVIAARRRAVEARNWASRAAGEGWAQGRDAMGRGRDQAVDFFEENPLVVGALAVAAGAAIAAAMPRTRTEDEWFGAQSDAMIDEAERIYLEERHKAEAVARAVADEAEKVVREKGAKAESAARSAIDEAKKDIEEAASRVSDTAKKEVDKEDLGKPKT